MPEWLTFLLADTSALQLVFWFIAIGALIAVIVKLWPALTQLVTIVNSVTGLPAFIARTDETLLSHDVKIEAIPCRADYDHDGFITGIDYDLFVQDFEAGVMNADFDGDGFLTGIDFDLYVVAYEAGC